VYPQHVWIEECYQKANQDCSKLRDWIIDLIISLEPSKVIKSGSLDPGISDHRLVYSVINLQKPVKKPRIRMVKELQNYEH